jgi:hypothetical protein
MSLEKCLASNMQEDIKKILSAAITAPSGENTQPWKFEVRGLIIDVINDDKRDQSVYNWGQRGALIANGAVIENIVISAKELGYTPNIMLLPEDTNKHLVARISLTKTPVPRDPLYPEIFKRVTNRKPYKKEALTKSELEGLLNCGTFGNIKIHFTQEHEHKQLLGKAGSANEVIMLNNKELHEFFFNHINWNQEEDDEKKIGFFIDTLELAPPARASFKIIKNWRVISVFNKLGFHKMVGKQNAQTNAAASGFGVLTIPNLEPKNFLEAGRTLQRFWLTATKLDLSMQPLTGIIFFMYRILANETERFSPEQIGIIKLAYNEVRSTFGISEAETIAFMFRIGHGDKPSARSSRFPMEGVTTFISQ